MKSKQSLHSQLIEALTQRIHGMEVGQKLPSERKLCTIYKVSRTTVRNVILELEHLGLLERIQGKGTFVQSPENTQQDLAKYYSFTETTRKLGRKPKTEILEFNEIFPNNDLASIFGFVQKEKLIQFKRLRKADDEPQLLEYTYIKHSEFSDITKELLEEIPLYEVFEKNYGRKIIKVKEIYSATILDDEASSLLMTEKNSAALKIVRYSYDKRGKILEYSESYAAGDKFKYESTYYPK